MAEVGGSQREVECHGNREGKRKREKKGVGGPFQI